MDAQLAVDDCHVVAAHLAGAHRVVDVVALLTQEVTDVFVAFHIIAWEDFITPPVGEGILGHDLAHGLDATDHPFHVIRVLQEARIDQRRGAWVGITQGDVAPALGTQNADVTRVAVAHAEQQVEAVVIQFGGGQVQLQIGNLLLRPGFDKAPGFRHVGGELPGTTVEEVDKAFQAGSEQGSRRQAQGVLAKALVNHQGIRVVLQIFAHAGQVVNQGNIVFSQFRCRTHAGKLENLWRVDGAAGEDDFVVGLQSADLTLVLHFHADGSFAIEQYPIDQGVGHDGQVGPVHDRVQIGSGDATTLTVLLVHLVHAHAFLDIVVEVVGSGVPSLNARFNKGVTDRVSETQVGDVQLAMGAVEFTFSGLILLAAFEHWQNIVEAPAFITQ